MTDRWVAASAEHLAWTLAAETHAVFHRPSGKTHFVNDAARLLLSEILREPRSSEDGARALAERRGTAPDADFGAQVETLLHRLEELGLVHRC